jgi:DNA-binding transcriptional LysR family regulator
VDLEIDISNRNIDFVDEGYDLAIRLGNPADSGLVARKLEDATLGVFASPAYLKSAGTPATVADLDAHRCIQFVLPSTGRPLPWLFRDNGKDVEYQFRSSLQCSGDVLGCLTLARNGGGLVQMYHFIVEEDQRSGRLVEVAKESAGRSRPFSIFYPHNRHMPSRVRSFVDFLCEEIGKPKKN